MSKPKCAVTDCPAEPGWKVWEPWPATLDDLCEEHVNEWLTAEASVERRGVDCPERSATPRDDRTGWERG